MARRLVQLSARTRNGFANMLDDRRVGTQVDTQKHFVFAEDRVNTNNLAILQHTLTHSEEGRKLTNRCEFQIVPEFVNRVLARLECPVDTLENFAGSVSQLEIVFEPVVNIMEFLLVVYLNKHILGNPTESVFLQIHVFLGVSFQGRETMEVSRPQLHRNRDRLSNTLAALGVGNRNHVGSAGFNSCRIGYALHTFHTFVNRAPALDILATFFACFTFTADDTLLFLFLLLTHFPLTFFLLILLAQLLLFTSCLTFSIFHLRVIREIRSIEEFCPFGRTDLRFFRHVNNVERHTATERRHSIQSFLERNGCGRVPLARSAQVGNKTRAKLSHHRQRKQRQKVDIFVLPVDGFERAQVPSLRIVKLLVIHERQVIKLVRAVEFSSRFDFQHFRTPALFHLPEFVIHHVVQRSNSTDLSAVFVASNHAFEWLVAETISVAKHRNTQLEASVFLFRRNVVSFKHVF